MSGCAVDALKRAVSQGLITGIEDSASRAQLAAILQRFQKEN